MYLSPIAFDLGLQGACQTNRLRGLISTAVIRGSKDTYSNSVPDLVQLLNSSSEDGEQQPQTAGEWTFYLYLHSRLKYLKRLKSCNHAFLSVPSNLEPEHPLRYCESPSSTDKLSSVRFGVIFPLFIRWFYLFVCWNFAFYVRVFISFGFLSEQDRLIIDLFNYLFPCVESTTF